MTRCFVIGPIGNKHAEFGSPGRQLYEEALEVYESVIRPACVANGLEPVRADGIAVPGEITGQIFRHLYEDEVVIADVSGANPNVMYELGLRHTRDLLTVQIGEYGQLPFDFNTVRTIQFSRSERGLIDAREALSRTLKVGLADGGDPLLATRIWNGEPSIETSASELESESSEDVDDLDEDGLLDRIAKIELVFPDMTETLEAITEVMESMGADAAEFGTEFDELNSAEAPTSHRLSAIARYGKLLQKQGDEFAALTNTFSDQMKSTDEVMRGIIRDVSANPDFFFDENTESFLDEVSGMASNARESMESLSQFGDQVYSLGSMSRVLRRPARQIRDSVHRIAASTSVMDEWESDIAKLKIATRAERESRELTEAPAPSTDT